METINFPIHKKGTKMDSKNYSSDTDYKPTILGNTTCRSNKEHRSRNAKRLMEEVLRRPGRRARSIPIHRVLAKDTLADVGLIIKSDQSRKEY
ncbi:unnamed protein product [Acanthoscelides obtectus]|uniref:Uncharacterized protein n=1 Tax=Acanthoscelides obtectus TaxID=200917 RepID=A0A9P0KW05_ACAOB|nr:unnamed protein product [Acanthoscelides obtectus]CAK1643219.1 hypothetical protein AOBTE_LOCUS13451 [Acanthoscelides obtectus]